MTQTKTAMYDTRGAAETARDGLISLGVSSSDISIRGTDDTTATTTDTEDKGFWASLADVFMPDDDKYTYAEGVRRGGFLLSARVPDSLSADAEDVLEGADPIDLDERTETWRQDGWTREGTGMGGTYAAAGAGSIAGTGLGEDRMGYDRTTSTGTMGTTDTMAGSTAAGYGTTGSLGSSVAGTRASDDETLEVVEENIKVGKRETGGGRVRVRTYVTERPVEEDVNLRSEHVTIERRPVDREVAPGIGAFQDRTIEAVERGEEAVVSKTARVKEEIALHKDVETRTETIRDTVRSTEVEVDDDRSVTGNVDPLRRRDTI